MPDRLKGLIQEVKTLAASEENQRRQEVQRRLGRKERLPRTPFNSWTITGGFPLMILDWRNWLGVDIDARAVAGQTGPLTPDFAAEVAEFQLLQKIHKFKNIPEDLPISTDICTNLGLCWLYRPGVLGDTYLIEEGTGAFVPRPFLKTEADVDKLEMPVFAYDEPLRRQRVGVFEEVLEGEFSVTDDNLPGGVGAPFSTANNLRGVLEILEDMAERPTFVHRLMDYIVRATLDYNRQKRQKMGGVRMGTFGCDEVSCDMLSPASYEEFIYPYELRVAEEMDSIYYHSCGNLTPLFKKIATIPNVHRVHVSPWSDLKTAIRDAGGKVVLEKHLHPSIDLDAMSREEMRAYVKEVTDLGVDYPLDMVVATQTPGGRFYREIFYDETA